MTGPYLDPLRTRGDVFEQTVATTAEYLRDMWPEELDDVTFEVAGLPSEVVPAAGVPRWLTLAEERRVIFYRVPIERLTRLHRNDAWHRRVLIESVVFAAVAELLGTNPGNLGTPGSPKL